MKTAPKPQSTPTVESQPKENADYFPKVLDFSAAKNMALAKEGTTLEKNLSKSRWAESPDNHEPRCSKVRKLPNGSDDSEMKVLVESIKANGDNRTALVRTREYGVYENITCNSRQKAKSPLPKK